MACAFCDEQGDRVCSDCGEVFCDDCSWDDLEISDWTGLPDDCCNQCGAEYADEDDQL